MNDLKQLFGSYNICARFAPGFLFIIAIYFLFGYDIEIWQDNSILFAILLFILSGVCGFMSASLIKIIEWALWKLWINPTILYLKISNHTLYKELLHKRKNNDSIITHLKKVTRDDNKLFWKSVSYGFFRNSILLSLVCLCFSYSTEYICLNLCACIAIIIMTIVCTFYYAVQAIESYQE